MRAARLLTTALGFAALGLGALGVALWIPLLRLRGGDAEARELRAQRLIHRAVRGYLRALERVRVLRVRVEGAEQLRAPSTLVVANHPTLLDALALMAHMPQADCVVKASWYEHPVLRGACRGAGYIAMVDGPGTVDACVERLRRGRSLIVFPEGTRSPVGRLGPFQRGAAHIALRAGRDPLPVAITCEPPTLYHGQPWWRAAERRFDLSLRVGEPLELGKHVERGWSRGRAARALTAALHDDLERRAIDVGA